VIFGGEALNLQDLKPWFERFGDSGPLLVNMYGITETTVHVSYRPLALQDVAGGSVIGGPIPDLRLHLVDSEMALVPTPVIGEIYVGGAGVARGYLGRGDLTAERFLPDPFSGVPGARLYKTGDLARRRGAGDLIYIGRVDHQVKIRGHRIELGEIETTMRQHPDVQDAAVLLSNDEPDEKRIVAFVVAKGPGAQANNDLRGWLAGKLPYYMLPSHIAFVEKMPLLPNGKLDRRSLESLSHQRPSLDVPLVSPQNALEKIVANAWKTALKLDEVGVDDNFFDLGGHSLLMLEVKGLLESELEIEIAATDMFEYSTVRAMAQYLAGLEPLTPAVAAGQERGAQQRAVQERTRLARQKAFAYKDSD
jgi:acyl carrier protein